MSLSAIRPLNYSIANQAAYSDAFNQSMKITGGARNIVNATSPVSYPNAEYVSASPNSVDISEKYNKIASAYEGVTTGYSNSGASTGVEVLGSKIDLYA